ncbi:hypothetical protein HOJ01_00015 [bacterium]|jgi:hypothetical protein|nr:hypothetical protein [bacterium]MBT6293177.1 hypothetical protein [bacterium]
MGSSNSSTQIPRFQHKEFSTPYKIDSMEAVILDHYLKGLIQPSVPISMAYSQINKLYSERNPGVLTQGMEVEKLLTELRRYYYDCGYETIDQMSPSFLSKTIALSVRSVFENIRDTGVLPSGFPYIGPGSDMYFDLIRSKEYEVSRESLKDYTDFLGTLFVNGTFYENLIFLGMGDGAEISATLNSLSDHVTKKIKSITMVDMTLSGMKHVVEKFNVDPIISSLPDLEIIGRVSRFEDVKITARRDETYSGNLYLWVGKTSGNFKILDYLNILNGFTADGSSVITDFGIYDNKSELLYIKNQYEGDRNRDFLLSNLVTLLKDLGCSNSHLNEINRSFRVSLQPEKDFQTFISINSEVTLPNSVVDIIEDRFGFIVPNDITLMQSYRRKMIDLIDVLQSYGYSLNQLYRVKGKSDIFTLVERTIS